MSFFDFFRKSGKSTETTVINEPQPSVNTSLFVENQPPVDTEETNVSPLSQFLNQNYQHQGFNEGYMYPNAELLNSNLKKLRTDFRRVVDLIFDQKRSDINDLKLHQIRTKGVSEQLDHELEHKVSELENLLHELDIQKILSVEDEGLLALVVNDYRIGFIKGIERYNQENFLVGGSKLF